MNDVAFAFNITHHQAEEMVGRYGTSEAPERTIDLAPSAQGRINGDQRFSIPQKMLAEILDARSTEFAKFIRARLKTAGVNNARVILAGEGADIGGLAKIVEPYLLGHEVSRAISKNADGSYGPALEGRKPAPM